MRIKLSYLEIETCNLCDSTCPWCLFGQIPGFNGEELVLLGTCYIKDIFYELKENRFRGVISLHSMNEPLLDSRILDGSLFELCKEILGNSVEIKITTNGNLLPDEIGYMFNAGLDLINISCYNEAMLDKATMLQKKIANIKILDYTNENAEKLNFNRAGSIKSYTGYPGTNKKSCLLPLYMSIIGFNGEVRLCFNDPTGQLKLGNIKNEKLYDILNNKYMKNLRNEICLNRSFVFPCNICNFDDPVKE